MMMYGLPRSFLFKYRRQISFVDLYICVLLSLLHNICFLWREGKVESERHQTLLAPPLALDTPIEILLISLIILAMAGVYSGCKLLFSPTDSTFFLFFQISLFITDRSRIVPPNHCLMDVAISTLPPLPASLIFRCIFHIHTDPYKIIMSNWILSGIIT